MDNLTHTLVGGALAAGGLGRHAPRATATLLIGANLPDLDALTYAVGSDYALACRRGVTHGVLALAVLPLVLTAAVVLWDRIAACRQPSRTAAADPCRLLPLAYLAVATHPCLDWLNTYGIRLLMPFDERWFYGDTLFIVDPWLWLLVGGALFLGHSASRRRLILWTILAVLTTLAMLAAAPAGARTLWLVGVLGLAVVRTAAPQIPKHRRGLARLALVLAVLYVGVLFATTATARRQVRGALTAEGIAPLEDLMVGPLKAIPWRHDVIVVTPDSYRFGTFDWFARPRFWLAAGRRSRPPATPVVMAALAAPSIRGMAGWMRYPAVEVDELDDGYEVHILDLRYARERQRRFGTDRVRLRRDLTIVPRE